MAKALRITLKWDQFKFTTIHKTGTKIAVLSVLQNISSNMQFHFYTFYSIVLHLLFHKSCTHNLGYLDGEN